MILLTGIRHRSSVLFYQKKCDKKRTLPTQCPAMIIKTEINLAFSLQHLQSLLFELSRPLFSYSQFPEAHVRLLFRWGRDMIWRAFQTAVELYPPSPGLYHAEAPRHIRSSGQKGNF